MKSRIWFVLLLASFVLSAALYGQEKRHDKAAFVEYKNEFYDQIKKELKSYEQKEKAPRKVLKMDFSGMDLPTSKDQFTYSWHNDPVAQGRTGTCWCFAATSFYESEIHRLTGREIKLSEMYTVYWQYVEKARRFIRERGDSEFGEGSETNAVARMWRKYGIVPEEAYTGLQPGQPFHDHSKMFAEMRNYLQSIKKSNAWNEDEALGTIKSILNHYLGEPPTTVVVNGKTMTPQEYLRKVVKLPLDEYVDVMSLMQKPYYRMVEYAVPDNWWHSKAYFNVPLDDFMRILKQAVRKGYTVAIGGDVSEAGYESHAEVAMVPTFDIPAEYIDAYARQFRFSNHTTTDDHAIHVVGYLEKDGKDWYLIKDSGSGSRNGRNKGYYFYHEDYVKLKMMNLMLHRSALEDILQKLQEPSD